MPVEYYQGAELPDVALTWTDEVTGLIDFSSSWTFTLRVGHSGEVALLEKTAGITGAATAPNVIIAWAAGELDVLAPDTYDADIEAKNVSGKDRKRRFTFTLLPAVEDIP